MVEGAAKLDCLGWGLASDCIVQAVEGKIVDEPVLAALLGDAGLSQRSRTNRRGRTMTCPKQICSASLVRTKEGLLAVELWQP
mmetsp:Transcript_12304/g.18587  ORF Transcript_12304/g.18587 Transcript_12304/m.18587 type:complete len:83 (+) Transcript_12304:1100-1348(+)